MNSEFPMKTAQPADAPYFYSGNSRDERCIGHMRTDFGSNGDEFWHSWHPGNAGAFNTPDFRAELRALVECLRTDLLRSRAAMRRYLREHPGLLLEDDCEKFIGYNMQTKKYAYYIRCAPSRGSYDCYIYCYANVSWDDDWHPTDVQPEDDLHDQ